MKSFSSLIKIINIVCVCMLFFISNLHAQRFKERIQAFKERDSVSPPPKNAILLIGSSSFTKWTDVQSYFPNYTIINRGFGGSVLPELSYYAEDVIFPYHPKQVLIYCGDNDLTSARVTPDSLLARFTTLFYQIRNKLGNEVQISYISIKPSPSRANLIKKIEASNTLVSLFLKDQKNTSFIDVYHKMLNKDGSIMSNIFLEDRLHMNASGYAIWQKEIEPYLVKTVKTNQRLTLANLFTDNMVLQQGIKAPVWGEASPRENIHIEFDGTVTSAKADKEGKWMARIPEHKAGGPFVMKISGSASSIVLNNVMVGEVWLASGQSNMAFTMDRSSQADVDIPQANYPAIRLITVPLNTSPLPVSDIKPTQWEMCTPSVVKSFSAVAYYFANELYKEQQVPIGIISASLGSSAAEAWTSKNMLAQLPEFQDRLLKLDTDTVAWNAKVAKINDYEHRERRKIAIAAAEGIKAGVQLPDYNDTSWKTSDFPMNMSKLGLPRYWGFIWFRKEFNLTKEQAEKDLRMELPIYCDEFLLYFNGIETGGRIYKQPMPSTYVIPKDRIKEGKNVIAIRMRTYWGTGYIGTSDSKAPEITSTDNTVHIPIATGWKFNATIEPKIYPNQEYFNTPTVLYNGMIAPIIPYAMKGVIWYQGETNASRPIEYRTLFPALITDWRKKWNQGDFPFLFVQLASRLREGVLNIQYAMLREAQADALKLFNTAMATAVDLGEKNETHPKNKKDLGIRLALAALKVAYHQDIVFSGPVYQNMHIEGDKIRLTFSNTGSGLMVKGAALKGFKIAGKDGVFYSATASLSGNEVLVSSPKVPLPKAVRYCFESWSEGNLYNKEGIAAPQFRTDNWEVVKNSK